MAMKKRQTLKQRALAIINDPNRYDDDTRHAVRNMLEKKASDLAEFVRRAERGETILDLEKPLEWTPEQAASDEQEPDIRQRLPEAAGLRGGARDAMRLVNRILHPGSIDDAAHALFDLLHLVGWNDEADGRHFAALCASIQTALYFDQWERDMRLLLIDLKRDGRRLRAEVQEGGQAAG